MYRRPFHFSGNEAIYPGHTRTQFAAYFHLVFGFGLQELLHGRGAFDD